MIDDENGSQATLYAVPERRDITNPSMGACAHPPRELGRRIDDVMMTVPEPGLVIR
jgi:hypothetical protein